MSGNVTVLADGTKCYSGPNCAWHSPTGSAKARRELRAATEALNVATTYEEVEAARNRLKDASKAYDASADGLKDLYTEYDLVTDRTESQAIRNRIKDAQERIAAAEAELQISGGTNRPELIPSTHTYELAEDTRTVENGTTTVVGANYKSGVYDPKIIKAGIVKEFDKAQAAGYLPKHLKYSVTIDRYSRGYSMVVSIRGTEDQEIFADRDDHDNWNRYNGYTPQGKELLDRVTKIVGSFNYYRSFVYDDYPSIGFGKSVNFESEADKKLRETQNDLAKVKRVRKAAKTALVNEVNKGSDWLALSKKHPLTDTVTLKDGITASRLNGTSMIVFKRGNEILNILNLEKNDTRNQLMKDLEGTEGERILARNRSRSVI